MSIECGVCERDARSGHAETCPYHPANQALSVAGEMAEELRQIDQACRNTGVELESTRVLIERWDAIQEQLADTEEHF